MGRLDRWFAVVSHSFGVVGNSTAEMAPDYRVNASPTRCATPPSGTEIDVARRLIRELPSMAKREAQRRSFTPARSGLRASNAADYASNSWILLIAAAFPPTT
jgi:hypothetical protein